MARLMTIAELMKEKESEILNAWLEVIDRDGGARRTEMLMSKQSLKDEAKSLASTSIQAFESEDYRDLDAPLFQPLLVLLCEISASRARQGFSPTETAMFVVSLKWALLPFMQQAFQSDSAHLNNEIIKMNILIDRMSLVTYEAYVQSREEVINEQSRSLLENSTPVIKLWDGVVILPLVGIIDTARSQHIISSLLKGIIDNQAQVAVLDVTGVPMMDTRVAQYLINTVDAAHMLGAEVVLTGISADAAQTLVRLNVDLSGLRTSGLLKNGIKDALAIVGKEIVNKVASS